MSESEHYCNDKLMIDPEFAGTCRPLTADEEKRLRESLLDNGCQSPVIVWRDHDIVVDGHNRVRICRELGVDFAVRQMVFTDRNDVEAWIINNQLARRNLDASERMYLVGRKYRNEKQRHGGQIPGSPGSAQNAHSKKTAEKIAAEEGLHPATVRHAEKFADAVDAAVAKAPEIKTTIISGAVNQQDVPALAAAPAEVLRDLAQLPHGQQRAAARAIREGTPPAMAGDYATRILDRNGRPVPDHLRGIFLGTRRNLLFARRQVTVILKILETLSADKQAVAFLEYRELRNQLNNAHHALTFALPHAVCPYCQGVVQLTTGPANPARAAGGSTRQSILTFRRNCGSSRFSSEYLGEPNDVFPNGKWRSDCPRSRDAVMVQREAAILSGGRGALHHIIIQSQAIYDTGRTGKESSILKRRTRAASADRLDFSRPGSRRRVRSRTGPRKMQESRLW